MCGKFDSPTWKSVYTLLGFWAVLGMATVSTAFGCEAREQAQAKCDKELQAIVSDVQHYLQSYDRKRFFLSVSVKYHKRCCKSWARIGCQLQRFLDAPKDQYSNLMIILEREVDNFPKGSYYGKRLRKLVCLLEKGPLFSLKYPF